MGKELFHHPLVPGQLDFHMQKNEALLTPYTKITTKWINVLNVGAKITKLLGKNIGINLLDHRLGIRRRYDTKRGAREKKKSQIRLHEMN